MCSWPWAAPGAEGREADLGILYHYQSPFEKMGDCMGEPRGETAQLGEIHLIPHPCEFRQGWHLQKALGRPLGLGSHCSMGLAFYHVALSYRAGLTEPLRGQASSGLSFLFCQIPKGVLGLAFSWERGAKVDEQLPGGRTTYPVCLLW